MLINIYVFRITYVGTARGGRDMTGVVCLTLDQEYRPQRLNVVVFHQEKACNLMTNSDMKP